MTDPALVIPPSGGLWRIGRSPDPYEWRRPPPVDTSQHRAGNRFDSFHGDFAVLYFGTTKEACYAETLARFRPDPVLVAAFRDEWEANGWMLPGAIPADWRHNRVLTRARVESPLPFIDIAHGDTLSSIASDPRLQRWFIAFDIDESDLATVVGRDRRVTRLISQWAAEAVTTDGHPAFGGIRYPSRLGTSYQCWAVFEGSNLIELETGPILPTDADLIAVCQRYGLTVH